jgi:hypothetical protein
MTSFVHTEYPSSHPGLDRAEASVDAIKSLAARIGSSSRSLAALLGAAAVAALALLATPAHQVAHRIHTGLATWRAARKAAREDRQMWELALSDARVMSDLRHAMDRAGG